MYLEGVQYVPPSQPCGTEDVKDRSLGLHTRLLLRNWLLWQSCSMGRGQGSKVTSSTELASAVANLLRKTGTASLPELGGTFSRISTVSSARK